MERKQDIRKELLKKRNSLTEEQFQKYSTLITEQFCSLEQYKKADILLIYASYQNEVSTYGIIEDALLAGKRIFCPKVLGPGNMEFYEIHSLADIIRGFKNIPEPASTGFPYQNSQNSNTLMVMPLVGYDSAKNRLGYGGGFYDRYLQRFPALNRIALGFECQRYEREIPIEETDFRPDLIITEHTMF